MFYSRLFMVIGGLLVAVQGQAAGQNQHVEEFDNYIIHYNAVPTDFFSTKIAKQYKITRSRNRIMLNIAVRKKQPGRQPTHVKAKVNVIATNLVGQIKTATMRPIHEGSSIYYIGELNVSDHERLKFNVKVTPDNEKKTYTVKFAQQFSTR